MRTRLLPAACLLLGALLPVFPARADVTVVATLAPDTAGFWDDTAPRSDVPGSPCVVCDDYAIDLTGTGARLRVAIDGPQFVQLQLLRADGSFHSQVQGNMSAEAYVPAPAPGRWWIRVYDTDHFRLRAKLESAVVTPPADATPLLPDLRLTPPYQFTFTAGCNTYEQVEYGAKRCLRFSLGPENIGPGPFLLRIPTADGLVLPGPIYQRILHGDGTITERQAGTGLFHKTHTHYHHNGFGTLEILRVTDRRHGGLVPVGNGPKQGFCMVDFRIADWRSFRNEATGDVQQDCAAVPLDTDVYMGLTAGWGDIYVWSLDGNYVEMDGVVDGVYVVRSTADAENVVLETDDANNSGYALIQISGTTVTVLERGFGTSPWDRHKRRVNDILPPNA